MDVNGSYFSDEFRMRPLLVWLCFGIVVLCAISVESVVHIIQGQPGPIFRNFIPAIPYGGVGPSLLSNRAQRQELYYAQNDDDEPEDDDDDGDGDGDEDGEDEDEDYGEDGYEGEYYYPILGSGPDFYQEGEYYDGNAEGGEVENVDDKEEIAGRQAYINNQYVERPNIRQSSRPRPQSTNRVPVSNNHRNPSTQPRPTRPSSRPTQQVSRPSSGSRPTRRKPTSAKKGVRQEAALPVVDKQGHRGGSANNKNQGQVNSKPKIRLNQLSPVATSTQFIATPVADLILRLSISLAKPVGRGANSTNLNVPIRIQQIAGSNAFQDDSPKKSPSRPQSETPKVTTTTTASPVEDDNEEDQEEEEEEREKTAVTIVTPLPRN